jgi:hypothetical protein
MQNEQLLNIDSFSNSEEFFNTLDFYISRALLTEPQKEIL